MDHWGDPWADADAHDADIKSTAKNEPVKTLPPPSPLPNRAPVVLNGFLDEAGWGAVEEDDGFGGWASSTNGGGFGHTGDSETSASAPETSTTKVGDWTEDGYTVGGNDHIKSEDDGWGALTAEQDFSSMSENVVSETSDSATTIQADEVPARHSLDGSDALNHDDDLSTRPSTSPSDVSHTEAPTESPRTSFEDERVHRKEAESGASPAQEEPSHTGDKDNLTAEEHSQEEALDEDGFGEFEDDKLEDIQSEEEEKIMIKDRDPPREPPIHVLAPSQQLDHSRDSAIISPPISGLDLDRSLMNDLFPRSESSKDLSETPEDPIYSTTARKAWYRLTRKQTMREYNNGGNDDNYVRVTWANSRIKQDVIKTVGRWASEDRMSSRGNAAGGFFNWDRPSAPVPNPVGPHVRKQSTTSASVPIQPTKQTTQPLATSIPAAFSWSSPMSTSDPWKQESTGNRSVSSPNMPKHAAVTRLQGQSPRSISVDLTSGGSAQANNKRTNTSISPDFDEEPPATAPSISSAFFDGADLSDSGHSPQPPLPVTETSDVDVWGDFSEMEKPTHPMHPMAKEVDDDEWGEMVDSPATPTLPTFPTHPSTPVQQPSTATSVPTPPAPSSSPWASVTARDALPVTRLKGAVSPTTANFKFNSFVPEGVIEGPIGPGLLKKSKSVQSTPDKSRSVPSSSLKVELNQPEIREEPNDPVDAADDFADFESSVPDGDAAGSLTPTLPSPTQVSQPVVMSTPSLAPPSPPAGPSSDTLDFSIFESAPTSIPSQPQPVPDLSDPWSIFDTPAPPPPAPAAEPALFIRPPVKSITPPPVLPLTGATNLAQKRKEEEDEIIRGIMNGLPDLRYMLRR